MNKNSDVLPETTENDCLKKMEVTYLRIAFTLFSICSYFFDVILDIFVAVRHYESGNDVYFGLTVLFITLPTVIMAFFSILWYVRDASTNRLKVSRIQWIIRILLTLFMAPVLRNFEALLYGMKSKKSVIEVQKENYARKMIYENTDASLLRLLEAFMECAPQLILQIYIIAQVPHYKLNDFSKTEIIQLISMLTSLVSMSGAIIFYLRSLRESLDHKNELSLSITLWPFLWRILEISARVVTLGLFASIFLPHFFLLSCIHFCLMFVWIYFYMKTDFCEFKHLEFAYDLVVSFVHIFCFVNVVDNITRLRCTIYYSLIFVENTILISVWYHYCSPGIIYRLPALIMVFLSFAGSIVIMTCYYVLFHPTRGIIFERSSSPKSRNGTVVRSDSIGEKFLLSRDVIVRARRKEDVVETTVQNSVEHNGKLPEINKDNEQNVEC